MYIETSFPRQHGDNAKLEYSVSSSDAGKLSCLKFYYHMHGHTINTLNVSSGNTTVFKKSGDQGNEWFKAKITVTLQNKVSFRFLRTFRATFNNTHSLSTTQKIIKINRSK